MKNNLIKGLLLCCLVFTASLLKAQELNCEVTVNAQKVTTVEPKVFQTLENAIEEFMNNRSWTDDAFEPEERIKCSLFINISSNPGQDIYSAQITVQSSRPVYNSGYESIMLNHVDGRFLFEYREFQPIEFNENLFLSNLSSVLAYYAYIIIGLDYDSFSPRGGEPYFTKAENIVNQAESEDGGWAPETDRNRYELIRDILSSRFDDFRTAWFQYHYNGLDNMYNEPEEGRTEVKKAMDLVRKVYNDNFDSYLLYIFGVTKGDEVASIFSMDTKEVKEEILDTLSKLDPGNSEDYREQIYSGGK